MVKNIFLQNLGKPVFQTNSNKVTVLPAYDHTLKTKKFEGYASTIGGNPKTPQNIIMFYMIIHSSLICL